MPGNGIEPLYMDFQSTALPLSYPSTIYTSLSPPTHTRKHTYVIEKFSSNMYYISYTYDF